MDLSRLTENGISVKDGMDYTGSEDKYISAIQRYYKGFENNAKAVRELLASSDTENYCIKVHALKSNSKMIGATELAKAFEELETASRNNDIVFINEHTEPSLKLYEEVIDIIKPIGEMETVKVSGEISADEAREAAAMLLEALDDFDDELSSELASKLMGYPFRMTQKQKLKEALDDIGNFMYDEAAELIKEITSCIE